MKSSFGSGKGDDWGRYFQKDLLSLNVSTEKTPSRTSSSYRFSLKKNCKYVMKNKMCILIPLLFNGWF